MSLMTMKEVSQLTCITENALRYYNEKGILPPTVRKETGRKQWLYDDEAVRRAKKILILRSIGVPVENITLVLEKEDGMDEKMINYRLEELLAEREAIDKQISVASMLLLLDDMSQDADGRDNMLDKMFENVCR